MHEPLKVGSLFSGIGGLDLGLERAGMRVIWQCEIDPYCRAVLAHHWPNVPCYEDVRDIGSDVPRVDLLCGGFPCQPVSLAGKGLAQEDPRWLWPEFARVVGLLLPRYVLVENVPGLATRGLGDVVGALAALGYDAEWDIVSAASVGAPHLRERLFVVAYSDRPRGGAGREVSLDTTGQGWWAAEARQEDLQPEGRQAYCPDTESPSGPLADTDSEAWYSSRCASQEVYRSEEIERSGRRGRGFGEPWAVEPDVGRVAHGVPNRLPQLRALGNAVVPQVAEFVGRLIVSAEEDRRAA